MDFTNEVEAISWLRQQDALYEEGDSVVSDEEYDSIKKKAFSLFGSNAYFTGVGSPVRGKKVRLPFEMSGLPQIYEGDNWVDPSKDYVATEKLDGTSAQIIYSPDGALQIAYSRGDGLEGADITRHILQIPNIPKKIPALGKTIGVRAEIIMKKEDFAEVQKKFPRSGNTPFKNARNAVAGIMNSSSNPPELYKYLNGVAYTIFDCSEVKGKQLHYLKSWGFEVVDCILASGKGLTDEKLKELVKNFKALSSYELDGIVLNENLPNGQGVKFKVADEGNLKTTTVKEVLYRISKDGYLKPRVMFDPIELVGVTVNFATAFNAKYIKYNNIGPGTKISITRSGDVIPYILGVDSPTIASLPDVEEWGDWEWSENEVDAVLTDFLDRKDVRIKKFVDVFTKLKVEHLKDGNLEKLYDQGYHTLQSIIKASQKDLVQALGENGNKVYESLKSRLNPVYWPVLVGSLGLMGRGIGRKKMTLLYDALEGDLNKMQNLEEVLKVEGFQLKTATKVVDSLPMVLDFIKDLPITITTYTPKVVSGDSMKGQAVVFTGVRSESLERKIVEQGGEIKSGISAKVTILVCKDPTSTSDKMKKAQALGIKIMGLKELESLLG